MSYILDALRRAELERERGQVPGLHAQAEPPGLGEREASAQGARGRRVAMVVGGVVLLGAIGAWWSSRGVAPPATAPEGAARDAAASRDGATAMPVVPAPAPVETAAASPPLLVAPPAPPAPPAPARLPPGAAAPVSPTPTPSPSPSPPPTPAAPAPEATRVPVSPPAPPSVPPTSPPPAALAAPPATAATAATAPAGSPPSPSAPARPVLLSDLPPAQRAELPQMLIGGAIYSDQPASRFVVINGLVVREGETAAPGVVLERIAPKSAFIRWREMRIELPI